MTLTEHIDRLFHTLVIMERWRIIVALCAWCLSTIGAYYLGYKRGRKLPYGMVRVRSVGKGTAMKYEENAL